MKSFTVIIIYLFKKIYLFQVLSRFPWGDFGGERCRNSHIQEVKTNIIIKM